MDDQVEQRARLVGIGLVFAEAVSATVPPDAKFGVSVDSVPSAEHLTGAQFGIVQLSWGSVAGESEEPALCVDDFRDWEESGLTLVVQPPSVAEADVLVAGAMLDNLVTDGSAGQAAAAGCCGPA
ncbi:hypothetical protein ABTX35_09020 [Streptomyces sp. NPDC096080]|uniref:hypothetical protein n=1 Tax=Streptomyces sp. NPDC096080 TaxID=3156693 RepID=UPI0033228134